MLDACLRRRPRRCGGMASAIELVDGHGTGPAGPGGALRHLPASQSTVAEVKKLAAWFGAFAAISAPNGGR